MILDKVVDSILAGNKIAISNDRDTLFRVVHAMSAKLKSIEPNAEEDHWNTITSNALQFTMDMSPVVEHTLSALCTMLTTYLIPLNPHTIVSFQAFADKYKSSVLEQSNRWKRKPPKQYEEENLRNHSRMYHVFGTNRVAV